MLVLPLSLTALLLIFPIIFPFPLKASCLKSPLLPLTPKRAAVILLTNSSFKIHVFRQRNEI